MAKLPKPTVPYSLFDLFPDEVESKPDKKVKKPRAKKQPKQKLRFPHPLDISTLEEGHTWVQENMNEGVVCPCCDKFFKRYTRPFNSTMARGLIWLVKTYEAQGTEWVDVPRLAPKWLVSSNQLASVRWWGFVERPAKSGDSSKKHSGKWRPTAAGIEAAHNRLQFRLTAVTLKGVVEDLVGDWVSLSETLDKKFDYQEVMRTILTDLDGDEEDYESIEDEDEDE